MMTSPDIELCGVAMVISPEESYLDLASRAGSGHLQAGTGRQGALGLPPPITAPVVCTGRRAQSDKRHLSFHSHQNDTLDMRHEDNAQ